MAVCFQEEEYFETAVKMMIVVVDSPCLDEEGEGEGGCPAAVSCPSSGVVRLMDETAAAAEGFLKRETEI